MNIYTGRIGGRYSDALDITVKSAAGDAKALAPTWDLVMGHKQKRISDEQYVQGYLTLLRKRYKQDSGPFLRILQRESVTLCCYCKAGAFCHRTIAADVLAKIAAAHDISVRCMGEH